MVEFSTIVILIWIGLLFVPIPPVATILGVLVILAGIALRVLFGI
ncbi:hypothetical protein [Halobiforma nitratireducens]|uniref:Auxin efflux carrier (AEC) family protein n=1 Tax=Halobiforma nitratireducens JCM 10879 TaxID=1227454 RepID=M0M6X9_9EURY|nr:hypothetical protein [Halobiforma nitratireducens]EMA41153.1 auxin efflux carrier (AEC) family protein [Halobiforma nitratireducens JCM 10879]